MKGKLTILVILAAALALAACGSTTTKTKTVVAKPATKSAAKTVAHADPQAKVACLRLVADFRTPIGHDPIGWITRIGKDASPLATHASADQAKAAWKMAGDVVHSLKALATGNSAALNTDALKADAQHVSAICNQILAS